MSEGRMEEKMVEKTNNAEDCAILVKIFRPEANAMTWVNAGRYVGNCYAEYNSTGLDKNGCTTCQTCQWSNKGTYQMHILAYSFR